MKNKLFPFVLLGFLIFLTGLILQFINPALSQQAYMVMATGNILSKFFGLLMLVLNSNILKTIYFKLIVVSMMIVITGEVFLILHWTGSFLLLISGSIGVIGVYSIRFYYKNEKKRLDVFKLLWILTTYIGVSFIALKYLPQEAGYICELLFWAMIIEYIISSRKAKAMID